MDQLILNQLRDGLKEITNDSFSLCEDDDDSISERGQRINKKAYDLKKLIDHCEHLRDDGK
jgi:hypothetical protein